MAHEQRCGTCGYYEPSTAAASHGRCTWDAIGVLPEAVRLEVSRWTRGPNDGRTCLCWEWRGEETDDTIDLLPFEEGGPR